MNKAKRIVKHAVILSLIFASVTHAGDMGDKSVRTYTPYLEAQGSYNWIDLGSPPVQINGNTPQSSDYRWGGRFSLGTLIYYTENLSFMAEIGGGYYGKNEVSLPRIATTGKISIDGYDVLAGALYKLKYLDVFGNIGFMLQNARSNHNQSDLSLSNNGNLFSGSSYYSANQTQILPEIRVGGIYNIQSRLGLTLSYMHAFGTTPYFSKNVTSTNASGINEQSVQKEENPSLNSIFLGIRYYIL